MAVIMLPIPPDALHNANSTEMARLIPLAAGRDDSVVRLDWISSLAADGTAAPSEFTWAEI